MRPQELLEVESENVHLDEGYLIANKYGNYYTKAVYHNSNWNTCMQNLLWDMQFQIVKVLPLKPAENLT